MERKKCVLVTGGAGFIGSHTVVELAEAGFDVIIVDNLSNSDFSAIDGIRRITGQDIPFEHVDCNDYGALKGIFMKYQFDSVIHFAAYKAVAESVAEPLKYYDNNLGSLVNVLELMVKFDVPNIVFSSSATVYGQPDSLPVTEKTPLKPATSPYGSTKKMSEEILQNCAAAYPEMNVLCLRYFNPIGAHPSALIGELPCGVPNNLVPFITQTAAGIREKLAIFGSDYDTPDGTCIRDYVDVVDLARAHVSALRRILSGQIDNFEVFNVGTGAPLSVLELVKTFERVNGVTVPREITGRRKGDVPELWADTSLANELLGWKAKRKIEETLKAAWEWQKRLQEKIPD